MSIIKSNGYSIRIGNGVFKDLSSFLSQANYSSYFIVCDENTLRLCLPKLITACPLLSDAEIIEIESGESSKSLEFCAHIWQTLIEQNADRKTLLIHLGGGVVSDLGGFTASAYKRGIDFINLPTTLLAMADASVGGKTGIDFAGIKNIIGSFAQPKGVFIYPGFLYSLDERQLKNGLAEVYKIALISDKKFWDALKKGIANPEILLTKSVRIKNGIVLKDPYDMGIRNILNFGHTLGHALETLFLGTSNELLHGEAIAIGMLLESHISMQKKTLPKKEFTEVEKVLKDVFYLQDIRQLSLSSIMETMKHDKKASKDSFRFSLIDGIGTCKFNVEVREAHIKKALDYYISVTA